MNEGADVAAKEAAKKHEAPETGLRNAFNVHFCHAIGVVVFASKFLPLWPVVPRAELQAANRQKLQRPPCCKNALAHQWVFCLGRWYCKVCYKNSGERLRARYDVAGCTGANRSLRKILQVTRGHAIVFAGGRTLRHCRTCGAWMTASPSNLFGNCTGKPRKAGKNALLRIKVFRRHPDKDVAILHEWPRSLAKEFLQSSAVESEPPATAPTPLHQTGPVETITTGGPGVSAQAAASVRERRAGLSCASMLASPPASLANRLWGEPWQDRGPRSLLSAPLAVAVSHQSRPRASSVPSRTLLAADAGVSKKELDAITRLAGRNRRGGVTTVEKTPPAPSIPGLLGPRACSTGEPCRADNLCAAWWPARFLTIILSARLLRRNPRRAPSTCRALPKTRSLEHRHWRKRKSPL